MREWTVCHFNAQDWFVSMQETSINGQDWFGSHVICTRVNTNGVGMKSNVSQYWWPIIYLYVYIFFHLIFYFKKMVNFFFEFHFHNILSNIIPKKRYLVLYLSTH